MSRVEQTIDVDVPLRRAYNQWTQFEEFPNFMEGVEDVRQLDDRHCHWRTRIAGVESEFDTEIIDQLPDERVSWRTVDGDVRQKGVVSFTQIDDQHTRVRLAMDVEPDGMAQKLAGALGMLDRRVKGDLRRFKGFIEERGEETGGWRGRIRPGDAVDPDAGMDAPPRGGAMEEPRSYPSREERRMTDPEMEGDRAIDPVTGERPMRGTMPGDTSPGEGPMGDGSMGHRSTGEGATGRGSTGEDGPMRDASTGRRPASDLPMSDGPLSDTPADEGPGPVRRVETRDLPPEAPESWPQPSEPDDRPPTPRER